MHTVGHSHVKFISVRVIEDRKGTRVENGCDTEDSFSFNVVVMFYEIRIKIRKIINTFLRDSAHPHLPVGCRESRGMDC